MMMMMMMMMLSHWLVSLTLKRRFRADGRDQDAFYDINNPFGV